MSCSQDQNVFGRLVFQGSTDITLELGQAPLWICKGHSSSSQNPKPALANPEQQNATPDKFLETAPRGEAGRYRIARFRPAIESEHASTTASSPSLCEQLVSQQHTNSHSHLHRSSHRQ